MVVLAVFGGYLFWANRLPPIEPDNRVFPNPNGYDAALAAVANMAPGPANFNAAQAPLATLRPFLQKDRRALDEMRAALRLEYMNPPVTNLSNTWPFLAQYREAARRFVGESRVAEADGKPALALERALDPVELGSRVGKGGSLIHHLVGLACSSIGVAAAERHVGNLSADEAQEAGGRLDRILKQFPNASEAILEERRIGLMTLRQMFSGHLNPAQLSGAGGAAANPGPALQRGFWFFYPKALTYGRMDGAYQAMAAEARKPYPQRQKVPLPHDPFARVFMPVMEQSTFVFTAHQARLRVIRMELALQERRQRRGRYPAKLEDLVPHMLAEIPQDPFSAGPFVYRRRGDSYLLYSVGPDGKDDGGQPLPARQMKPTSKGDLVAGTLGGRPPLQAPSGGR
jgi:hypothetical protein